MAIDLLILASGLLVGFNLGRAYESVWPAKWPTQR